MSHFLIETLALFGFGFLGVLIMAFVKMKDINDMNDEYTFSITFNKFIGREWPSYGLSIVIILATCLTHEEWLVWFEPGGALGKLSEAPIGVKIGMIGWGALGQYFIYKKWGKMKTADAAKKLDEKSNEGK